MTGDQGSQAGEDHGVADNATGGQRPRPQYGEYADDAPQAAAPGGSAEPSPSMNATAPAVAAGREASPAATSTPTSGALPGVPHNLGVSGAPARPVTSATTPPAQQPTSNTHGAPYQAPPPPGVQQTPPASSAHQASQSTAQPTPHSGAPRRGTADRIITILLLAVGAIGALNTAFLMMQLAPNMHVAAGIFGIENFVVPAAVSTIGTVGAVVILALYAVTLIFSIQRLRARKLTFWVPLAAGVIAFILYMALTLIAFSQSPELVQAMADPNALNTLLDSSAFDTSIN